MIFLGSIISLVSSFWMFIYIYGLSSVDSTAYHPTLYIFPIILLLIPLYFFLEKLKSKGYL